MSQCQTRLNASVSCPRYFTVPCAALQPSLMLCSVNFGVNYLLFLWLTFSAFTLVCASNIFRITEFASMSAFVVTPVSVGFLFPGSCLEHCGKLVICSLLSG